MKDIFHKFKESNNKFILFIKQFLIILFYLAITLLLQLIFLNVLKSSNMYLSNLCYIFIDLIILIIFLLLFRKIIVPDFYKFKKNGKQYLKNTYLYYIIGLLVMLISNMIISSFIGIPQNEEGNRKLIELLPYYSVIATVIFAPIVEELMTRVILKNGFKHKVFFILSSGLIFGFLHVAFAIENNILELLYIIPYGALGCALAKIYTEDDNIWTNIFFHSFHNFICILIIFLGA